MMRLASRKPRDHANTGKLVGVLSTEVNQSANRLFSFETEYRPTKTLGMT